MSIYRGYEIIKDKNSFYMKRKDTVYFSYIEYKTLEDAMNEIDSIERERVERDQATIERIDNEITK